MPSPSAAIEQLVEVLGEEEVRALVELYLDHTHAELQRLSSYPLEKQIMTVHALKGSSTQVGARLFGAQCRAVEARLRETRELLTASELASLQNEFATASGTFRAWLQSPRRGSG